MTAPAAEPRPPLAAPNSAAFATVPTNTADDSGSEFSNRSGAATTLPAPWPSRAGGLQGRASSVVCLGGHRSRPVCWQFACWQRAATALHFSEPTQCRVQLILENPAYQGVVVASADIHATDPSSCSRGTCREQPHRRQCWRGQQRCSNSQKTDKLPAVPASGTAIMPIPADSLLLAEDDSQC